MLKYNLSSVLLENDSVRRLYNIAGLAVESSIKLGRGLATALTAAELYLQPPREARFPVEYAFDDQYPKAHMRHICLLLAMRIYNDRRLETFLILVESMQEDDSHP